MHNKFAAKKATEFRNLAVLVYLQSFIVRGNLSLKNLGLMLFVDYLITWGLNVQGVMKQLHFMTW